MHAIVFDIDNTLTPPRRPLQQEMADVLSSLSVPFHLAAGSDLALVEEQLIAPLYRFGFRGTFDAFVCNGSHRYRCECRRGYQLRSVRTFDMRRHLGDAHFGVLMEALQRVLDLPEFQLPPPLTVLGDRIIDRGAMVNAAPIGRPREMNAAAYGNRDAFVQFDQHTGYRQRMLACLQRELAGLVATAGLRITLGGQTSFDLVIEGNDKTYALRTLLEEGCRALTYIGDALHDGGNDAVVSDFIRDWPSDTPCPVVAVEVAGWRDTIHRLYELSVCALPALDRPSPIIPAGPRARRARDSVLYGHHVR